MDTSSNEQPTARIATSHGKWILLTTVLGSSMVLLGSTVTNVALPHMGEDLAADLAALQWTVNAYMVTLAGLILLGGALGDRFGRRRTSSWAWCGSPPPPSCAGSPPTPAC